MTEATEFRRESGNLFNLAVYRRVGDYGSRVRSETRLVGAASRGAGYLTPSSSSSSSSSNLEEYEYEGEVVKNTDAEDGAPEGGVRAAEGAVRGVEDAD